jgi:hypothetical protein
MPYRKRGATEPWPQGNRIESVSRLQPTFSPPKELAPSAKGGQVHRTQSVYVVTWLCPTKSWVFGDRRDASQRTTQGANLRAPSPLTSRDVKLIQIGATRRLLNFSWPGSGVGKAFCNDDWMAQNLKKSDLTNGCKPVRSTQTLTFHRNGTACFLAKAWEA